MFTSSSPHFPPTPSTPYLLLLLLPPPRSLCSSSSHVSLARPPPPLCQYCYHCCCPSHIGRLRIGKLLGLLLQFSQFQLDVSIYVIRCIHSVNDLRHCIETPLYILEIVLLPVICGTYSGPSVLSHHIPLIPIGSLGVQICVVHGPVFVVIIIFIVLNCFLGGSVSRPRFLRTSLLVQRSNLAAFTSSQ